MTVSEKKDDLGVVGSFHADLISKISSETSINWHEVIHPYGKKPTALHPTPGTSFATSIGLIGPVRGAYVFNGIAYFCANNAVFSMDSALVVTALGAPNFTTTTGFVRIDSNQTQVVFVDGVSGLLWDTVALTLTVITFPVTVPAFIPADITQFNGYFVAIDKNSNNFYISALDDGTSWTSPVERAQINNRATFGVGCQALKNRLFLLGDNITVSWLNAGLANFPFRPDDNIVFEHGLAAVGTLVEGFDLLFYLSQDPGGVGSIKMVEGAYPVNASTYEIDNAIQSLAQQSTVNISNSIGMIYKINGIIFYKLTINNIINGINFGMTFIYNATMSTPNNRMWHQEMMADGTRHIANCHLFFNNHHYIGDYLTSSLFLYSVDITNNNGVAIPRIRIMRVFSDPAYRRIRVDRIQIDMLQGVGIPGSDNTDLPSLIQFADSHPFINLYKSIDGGDTYINLGSANIGMLGNRLYRTIFNKIGIDRQYTFKLVSFNEVPLYILGGAVYYEVLNE